MDELEESGETIEVPQTEAGDGGMSANPSAESGSAQTAAATKEEAKLLRRLQMMMNMVTGVIAQDSTLSYDEAAAMVADARNGGAGHVFPARNSPMT